MSKEQYIALITQWAALHPGGLWQDTPEAAKARKWLRKNAPDTFSAIYYNEPDEYRTKIDRRFLPAGVEAKNFKEDVREAINDAGTHVYNVLDKTTAWVPGPTGMVNWLGHVVADAAQGNVGNLAMHAGMAGLMGGAGRLAGKYLPKVASKIAANNPKFGTFMQKAGELANDLSWNRQRQDDAMAEWLANRDVRQRFNIGAAEPATTATGDAVGVTGAAFGSRFDGVPTKDTISSDLLDEWIGDISPDMQDAMRKARRLDWAKELLNYIDVPASMSPETMVTTTSFPYRLKQGADLPTVTTLLMNMRAGVPYKGNVHLPETLDITPFTSLFDEPIKARDTAFEIMQRAAAAKKLSPKPVEVSTSGDLDLPVLDRVDGQQIIAGDLKKPILWFKNGPLSSSNLHRGNTPEAVPWASIGMADALSPNAMGEWRAASGEVFHQLPIDVVGHEVGHIHPGFNTRSTWSSPTENPFSPYYGNEYIKVNPSAQKSLFPGEEVLNHVNDHDKELSEWFSDAMGVRTLMEMNGINKGMARPYNAADITRLNAKLKHRYGEVPKLRFMQMRPKIEDQVAALNYGWAEGGKLQR